MTKFHDPLKCELCVGLYHGIRADDELVGEHPNTRQLIAWRESADLDSVPDLIDQLQVDRQAGRGVETKQFLFHCITVMLQWIVRIVNGFVDSEAHRFPRRGLIYGILGVAGNMPPG